MPGGKAIYCETVAGGGFLVPVEFYNIVFGKAPVFEMFTYSQRTYYLAYMVFEFYYGFIIEVVPRSSVIIR